jgi:hypothetical protein
LNEAIQVATDTYGADAWQAASVRSLLGKGLAELGRMEEARVHLTESARILAAAHGADDPRTQEARERLEAFEAER